MKAASRALNGRPNKPEPSKVMQGFGDVAALVPYAYYPVKLGFSLIVESNSSYILDLRQIGQRIRQIKTYRKTLAGLE